ncbi:MAG: hypothetical protein P8Y12_04370 [Gammaproteobacteria bacterium]
MIINSTKWGRCRFRWLIIVIAILLFSGVSRAESGVWELAAKVDATAGISAGETASRHTSGPTQLKLMPARYGLYRLDEAQLTQALPNAVPQPTDGSISAAGSLEARIIEVPFPDGEMVRLRLQKTNVLAPTQGALHPEISTFSARGVDDPSIFGNLDLTPKGFHGLLLTSKGEVYIEPRSDGIERFYTTYYRTDYQPQEKSTGFSCGVDRERQSVKNSLLSRLPRSTRLFIMIQTMEFPLKMMPWLQLLRP